MLSHKQAVSQNSFMSKPNDLVNKNIFWDFLFSFCSGMIYTLFFSFLTHVHVSSSKSVICLPAKCTFTCVIVCMYHI